MNNNITIPFFRPMIDSAEEKAVCAVLRSGWLSTGKEVELFEEEFAGHTGVPFCCAVSSATAGLHLALEALHLQGKVALSPYTFAASANVILHSSLEPIFVDIEDNSFSIDPRKLENCIQKEDVRAVMPVHVTGLSCPMHSILALAKQYSLYVVEDAAHCFPAQDEYGFIGTRGDVGVYSFYANKTITCGEGGMLVTRNSELIEHVSTLRLHGMNRNAWDRYLHPQYNKYDITAAGYKYNLPDILASIARVQLRKAETMLEMRRKIAALYIELLCQLDYLILPEYSSHHSWHLFIIRLRLEQLSIDRDEYTRRLSARGIATSVHYRPLHLMSYFAKRFSLHPDDFPNASRRYREVISLPIYPGMDNSAVHAVCKAISDIGNSAIR